MNICEHFILVQVFKLAHMPHPSLKIASAVYAAKRGGHWQVVQRQSCCMASILVEFVWGTMGHRKWLTWHGKPRDLKANQIACFNGFQWRLWSTSEAWTFAYALYCYLVMLASFPWEALCWTRYYYCDEVGLDLEIGVWHGVRRVRSKNGVFWCRQGNGTLKTCWQRYFDWYSAVALGL